MIGAFIPIHDRRKDAPGWVIAENGCHIWTGYRNSYGYAFWHRVNPERFVSVYRYRYEREIGPIPEGMQLDHYVCDNGPGGCCNPHHCRPASHRENTLRGNTIVAAQLAKTHCVRGHPLSGDNLCPWALKRGSRRCKTCSRDARSRRDRQKRIATSTPTAEV